MCERISPPRTIVFTDFGIARALTISSMEEGGAIIMVIGSEGGGRRRSSAFRTITSAPPEASAAAYSNIDPSKLREQEARTRADCPASNRTRAQSAKADKLRCSPMTPLGLPVEPEV